METEYLMKSSAMMDAIRQGEDDIRNALFTTMKEDELSEELKSLLDV
jgi:hypothetical protein